MALAGLGTGYWLITFVLAALVLAGKRPNWLAYACVVGLIFAASFLVRELVTGANLYVALAFFGVAAVLFALGLVLVLTVGVTFFGHAATVRRLRREHDVDGLIALLGDSDPVTRAKAADVLAPLADPRAEQPLLQALADPNLDVRANAARALGVLKSNDAVEQLVHALRDGDGDVRYAAAWALGTAVVSQRGSDRVRRLRRPSGHLRRLLERSAPAEARESWRVTGPVGDRRSDCLLGRWRDRLDSNRRVSAVQPRTPAESATSRTLTGPQTVRRSPSTKTESASASSPSAATECARWRRCDQDPAVLTAKDPTEPRHGSQVPPGSSRACRPDSSGQSPDRLRQEWFPRMIAPAFGRATRPKEEP